MRVLCLSHFDLDGIVSSVNIYNSLSDHAKNEYQHFICGYYKIDLQIDKIKKTGFDVLFITDLNLTEVQLRRVGQLKTLKNRIIYIDHHEYEYDLQRVCDELHIKCIWDKEYSGCMNAYNSLSGITNIKHLHRLNEIAESYDLWRKDETFFNEAVPLNDIFWHYGAFDFFKRFKSGDLRYTPEEKEVLAKIKNERESYIEDSVNNHSIVNPDIPALFVFNPDKRYTNDFTIVKPGYNVYLILKEVKDGRYTYSLRISENNNLTCQNIYSNITDIEPELLLLAGGHKKTGGVTILAKDNVRFLDLFNEAIESLIIKE